MTRKLFFEKALLPGGWQDRVVITLDGGTITAVETGVDVVPLSAARPGGFAVPGMTNAHSHAFQRGIAGLAEFSAGGQDTFWTWRETMYGFLGALEPGDVYRIARQVYCEMLGAGYTTVAEFHYLLHRPDGSPHENLNAMADAVVRAADETGINLCLLPVFYERGGFDGAPLQGSQLRFGSTPGQFLDMAGDLADRWGKHPRVRLGIALHSWRAVSVKSATEIVKEARRILPQCPIHMHVAEQTREVEDCVRASGRRPLELWLDTFGPDRNWCLVHATHMTPAECRAVAGSGAVVCVCPTTEANLGDGIFRAAEFLSAGGRLAIGSDSHVAIDPREELRLLEYGQRLTQCKRLVLCRDGESCGTTLWQWAAAGGAAVTGFGPGAIETGTANGISRIDPELARSVPVERLLDVLVFQSVAGRNYLSALPAECSPG